MSALESKKWSNQKIKALLIMNDFNAIFKNPKKADLMKGINMFTRFEAHVCLLILFKNTFIVTDKIIYKSVERI